MGDSGQQQAAPEQETTTTTAPIPITIVTGFLGSGKTTLILNLVPQLKRADPNYKLALIKNEFGDVAVDSQLAASSAVSGVQELLNGCICCNLVGRLGDALAELRATARPDRIIVETSGSAFPATLALEVNRVARETAGAYVLDGVVSVIDVENWAGYDDVSYTARVQARYTDLVVLNKWEACGERRLDECLDRLGDLEVDVARVKSDRGWVSMDLVFGIDRALARGLTDDVDGHHEKEQKHDHSHDHQSEVEVLSITLEGAAGSSGTAAVNAESLQKLLKSAPKDEVYRIKAVLTTSATSPVLRGSDEDAAAPEIRSTTAEDQTSATPRRYILNWAFGRWTFTPVAESATEHESSSGIALRMTMILARYESTKWKKKLEGGGLLELAGGDAGELTVTKVAAPAA